MPKLITKSLTARQVETVGPGRYCDGDGLYLIVGPSSRSWIYRYQFRGQRRDMGLGSTRRVTLREARELAYEAARLLLREGVDPLDKKRETTTALTVSLRTGVTFEQCANEFLMAQKARWAPRYARDWHNSMRTHVFPTIGQLPITAVTINLLKPILEPHQGKLGRDLYIRLKQVHDFAHGSEYITIPLPLTHLKTLLPPPVKTKNHPMLPYSELPTFMGELRQDDRIAHHAVEFTILCGSRLNEVRGAQWPEINRAERWWTVPPGRMKGRQEHRVALSSAALAVLDRMAAIRTSDYIFANGAATLGINALDGVVKKLRPSVCLHGFRATFSTWAGETTDYEDNMIEIALAHSVGSAVARAYNRGDKLEKRRQLMEDWATYCA